MSKMSELDLMVQIEEARKFVLSMLSTMRSMKGCMPDGQWEDGPEDMFAELKEHMLPHDSEEWLELQQAMKDNITWWC